MYIIRRKLSIAEAILLKFFTDNKKRIYILFILTIIGIAVIFFTNKEKQPVSETRFMLDTVCTITLYEWNGDGERIVDEAFGLCGKYEKMLSSTVSGSDIFAINHSGGKPVEVSQETVELLERAKQYCKLSDGAFDITIYPVKSLWDFSGESASLPDQDSLSEAADLVDYTKIDIAGTTVTLPDGMGIDLGAIAKGYIADRAADYLRQQGVTSAIIDLGGNIFTIGKKSDGQLWCVGIRMPFEEGEADVVETSYSSVVTSGVYQRYFKKDGVLYHHILRSSDGMPCDTGLYSVTVISGCSEQCDALSTVCMLLGYEKSKTLLSGIKGIRAVFITSDNQLLYYN